MNPIAPLRPRPGTPLPQLLLATLLGVLPLLALSGGARADWPQWRGPDRTDSSTEKGLLKSWPKEGPKRRWLFEGAGLGYSGPAIVKDRLYTLGIRDGAEHLIALDVNEGKELWAVKLGEALKNDWGDGPRGTPCVEGDFVYALSGPGKLVCAQVADGKIVWEKSMKEFGGSRPGWGYTESVLVDGDNVVCTPGGPKGAILALKKKTGDTVWQTQDFTDGAQYASIVPITHHGQRQYIQLTMSHVVGVAAADGRKLWSLDFPGKVAVIPTPIFHDGQVYVSAGYGVGCKSAKIDDQNGVNEVYANKVMKNHHGGVILHEGHLYGHSDGGGWVCQKFDTGAEVWSERTALGKGAIGYADGQFYLVTENDGTVALIDASPTGWKEHGRFKLDPQTKQRSPQGRIWTHPVVTGGRLYLRDQEYIYCYDVRATAP